MGSRPPFGEEIESEELGWGRLVDGQAELLSLPLYMEKASRMERQALRWRHCC